MSNTYEGFDTKQTLETYEWDDIWIEHANDANAKRVTYIGDSISRGARRVATQATNNELLFDGYASSKAVDNPHFKDVLRLFFSQLPDYKTILFNNGLHGWHLDDQTEYPLYYEKMIKHFLSDYSSSELILVLTTAVVDKERNERVKIRNKAVIELSKKYSLKVIDLYHLTEQSLHLMAPDGEHPTAELNKKIALKIIEEVKN